MKLQDVVELVGHVPSEEVKNYMEKANIFIGTSDSNEGWGAVVNEAMNAGCGVVVNKKMGSVPFLIKDDDTGLVYKSFYDLERNVKELIKNVGLRFKISKNAYDYITTKWTGKIAAENIIELFDSIINNKECNIVEGPACKID